MRIYCFFRKQHSFLLSANAYKLRYENGIDIYGFDLLIQLVKSLKEKGINVGLVFCLPMIGDMEYYQKCLSSIKEMNIDDNILVVQREYLMDLRFGNYLICLLGLHILI